MTLDKMCHPIPPHSCETIKNYYTLKKLIKVMIFFLLSNHIYIHTPLGNGL